MFEYALVYLAFGFGVVAFLTRDELRLRLLMFAANATYIVFFYFGQDTPMWHSIFTNTSLALINLAVIVIVILERTTFAMASEMTAIYANFPHLSPGQFRRLMRLGRIETVSTDQSLTKAGEMVDQLCFVVDGSAELTKSQGTARLANARFVGELAFLTNQPASADVVALAGAKVIFWKFSDLRAILRKSHRFNIAFLATLNNDLVAKVVNSEPTALSRADSSPV